MSRFECEDCKKILKSRRNFELHRTRCKQKPVQENIVLKEHVLELTREISTFKEQVTELSKENAMLKSQLEEYKNQIFELAKRPTTTNTINNNQRTLQIINNLAPYDLENRELIEDIIDLYFTKDTFEKGPEELAKMIRAKFMTDEVSQQPKIVCTDSSRYVFRYKDRQNKLQKDDKLKKTHRLLSEPLNRMNYEYNYRHDTAETYPFEANKEFLEKRKKFTSTMMEVGVYTREE